MISATGRFGDLASFRLQILNRITERLAESQHRQAFGLTLLQARVLGVVGEAQALRFAEMIATLELEKGQASRLVAGLVDRGLLEKPPGKRAAVLSLTHAGRSMCDAIYEAALERNRMLLEGLSLQDVAAFDRCLSSMAARAQSLSASPQALPERSSARTQAVGAPRPDQEISVVLDRQTVAELHTKLGTALGLPGAFPTS